MPNISFIRGEGSLGRPLPNKDHVSAICLECPDADLPSPFTTLNRTIKMYSMDDVIAAGIVEDSASFKVRDAYYQCSEYFRFQPKGELYVHFYDSTAPNFSTILTTVIDFPIDGEIRLIALVGDFEPQDGSDAIVTAQITSPITAAQAVANAARTANKPVSILLGASDFNAEVTLSQLPDLRALSAQNVSFVIAHDGDPDARNEPAVGAFLGAIALAKVHESIGWVQKFNFSDGENLEILAVCHNDLLVTSTTAVDAIAAKGYLILKKHLGIAGSYAVDSPTSIALTSDYAMIENERTIDKAERSVRSAMLPNLNSPLYVNDDGSLREDTVAFFKATTETPLAAMQRDGEISTFLVTINPNQDILTTSTLEIGIKIVPVGVARQISIKIGFAVKITA